MARWRRMCLKRTASLGKPSLATAVPFSSVVGDSIMASATWKWRCAVRARTIFWA